MRDLFVEKREDEGTVEKGKEYTLTDYSVYKMTKKEKIFYLAIAAAVIYGVGYIFYHSHILSMILCPAALLYPKIRTREIIEKRKNELNIQFKDMLYSLASSLSAGKSVEMAFKEVLKDLAILYPDPDTSIIREVEFIVRKVEMNETIESALADFAERSQLEDIANFVDVFYTCKRTGGNIIEIIKNTSNIINDKIEIKQEIETLLAQRRFEQKVLNVLPVLMILLLSVSAADYVRPVFDELAGKLAMTISIGLLVIAYLISKKIMDIKV